MVRPVAPVPLHAAKSGTSCLAALAGVIAAAQTQGRRTAWEIAESVLEVGLAFDPERAKDIADAAAIQARTQYQAELQERGYQLAAMAGIKRTLNAVMRLCEGRPLTDHLPVSAVLDAAATQATPVDGIPMTIAWTGEAALPDGGARQRAVVKCMSAYGGPADLVLDGEERAALAALLGPAPQAPGLPPAAPAAAAGASGCVGCGCVEEAPCEGGCQRVPHAGLAELCSRCAYPEDVTPEPMPGGAR